MRGAARFVVLLCLVQFSCSLVKSSVTGYRSYKDDSGAFSMDTPLGWRMRRIMFPADQDFPPLRVIYVTPKGVADKVLPKVSEPGGLYGSPEPLVMVAAADEEFEGINDIPLADALGATNATTVNETTRMYGTVEAKETELRWSDPSGPKHGRTIILTRPGLTLFLLAMVGDSKSDAYSDTIDHMIDSFKPKTT